MKLTQKEIDDVQKLLDGMKAQMKAEQEDDWLTMTPTSWIIDSDGSIYSMGNLVTKAQEFGMRYHTKAQAEKSRDEMKKINLIRYYATILDAKKGWVVDWDDRRQTKYSIYYDYKNKIYNHASTYTLSNFTPHMSEETSDKIVAKLNSVELVLS